LSDYAPNVPPFFVLTMGRGSNKSIETVKEYSVKSKDYIKFIIGLSTGTLVFSGTLFKQFIQFPQYKFILIIGWAYLFISIILGVWILPGGDRLQSLVEGFKRLLAESPEMKKSLAEKKLQEFFVRDLVKKTLLPELESDERMKDFYKSLETAPLENLKKAFEKVSVLGVKEPDKIRFLKELVKEVLNYSSIVKIDEQMMYPPTLLKNIRRTIWQLIYLEKGMRYSFFIGMLAILIFSIINLLR